MSSGSPTIIPETPESQLNTTDPSHTLTHPPLNEYSSLYSPGTTRDIHNHTIHNINLDTTTNPTTTIPDNTSDADTHDTDQDQSSEPSSDDVLWYRG